MSTRSPLLLALLVLLAGCAGGLPGVDPSSTAADGTTAGQAGAAGTTAAGTGTSSTHPPSHVWAGDPVVVALDGSINDSRDWAPLVENATDYWSGVDQRYLGYDVEFVVRPNAPDPDIRITFVSAVTDCDGVADPVGCAPYYTTRNQVERPAEVQVRAGLSDDSTKLVTKHELGHVLGLDHGEGPRAVMNHTVTITTLDEPNATETANPWNDSLVTVYADTDAASDPAAAREQVRDAVAYFDRGANGSVPADVSFVLVDDPDRADVVVSYPESAPCTTGAGSCARREGLDVDGDGALERFTRVDIALVDVDTDRQGWHVAYWLGYAMGFSEGDDWPAPLADADEPSDRRGRWWAS
jgi:hypothetical protein